MESKIINSIILNDFQDENYTHILKVFKEWDSKYKGYSCIPMFAVYENPKDFPDKYVARLWKINRDIGETVPTEYCVVKNTLEEIREALPCGLYRFGRAASDDPVVIETWI